MKWTICGLYDGLRFYIMGKDRTGEEEGRLCLCVWCVCV